MLERLLPKTIDNRFRGHRVALWMFYPITLITIVRSLIHVFRSDGGAQSIATIPLDSFTEAGAAAVGAMKPIVTIDTAPGGPGSIVVVVMAITCIVLCLRGEGGSVKRETA